MDSKDPVQPQIPEISKPQTARGKFHCEPLQVDGLDLVFNQFRETPFITQQRMVLNYLLRWNVAVCSTHCCSYHARLDGLRKVCDTLQTYPCDNTFKCLCEYQCPNCFALGGEDDD